MAPTTPTSTCWVIIMASEVGRPTILVCRLRLGRARRAAKSVNFLSPLLVLSGKILAEQQVPRRGHFPEEAGRALVGELPRQSLPPHDRDAISGITHQRHCDLQELRDLLGWSPSIHCGPSRRNGRKRGTYPRLHCRHGFIGLPAKAQRREVADNIIQARTLGLLHLRKWAEFFQFCLLLGGERPPGISPEECRNMRWWVPRVICP